MNSSSTRRSPSSLSLLPLLACALAATAPSSSAAQEINRIKPAGPASVTLAGVVRDPDGRPLAAAELMVDKEHRSFTNARGEFSIPGLTPGLIEFTARRIGYNPTTTAIHVEAGLAVHLAVRLRPVAVQLGTMIIEGKRVDKALWQTGFYQRRDAGMGTYFDDEYLKRFHAGLGTLVANVPSVRVTRGRTAAAIPMGQLPSGGDCALNVFVDGNHVPWATTSGLDEVVNRDDVLAVEVYSRASDLPAKIVGRGGIQGVGSIGTVVVGGQASQYGGGFVECGAILVWTKPLERKRR